MLSGLLSWASLAADAARLWQIGPGELSATALAQAGDGDTIELRAGLYAGEGGVIRQRELTLRGSGAVLQAGPHLTEDKAILVLKGGRLRLGGAGVSRGTGSRSERARPFVWNEVSSV